MKPFVKWAGGKTQLLEDIRLVVPKEYNKYYEPFLGGGAVLFDLKPKHAVVSDANPQLINAYLAIRDNVYELMDYIDSIDKKGEVTKELYYSIREKFNDHIRNGITTTETAALLIWLNHHCFNGLYRTNRAGEFNTPWNRTTQIKGSYERENLIEISNYFRDQDIEIICEDYKSIMVLPQRGDFVFIDPPYDPVGKYGDFKRYTKNQFYEQDQIELAQYITNLRSMNVYFCLTNSNTDLIQELYKECKINVIRTHRNINSKGKGRFGEDAIITAE